MSNFTGAVARTTLEELDRIWLESGSRSNHLEDVLTEMLALGFDAAQEREGPNPYRPTSIEEHTAALREI